MKQTLTLLALAFVSAGCPSTGAGMIHRDVLRPSVDAVTAEFDELVTDAVSRGAMKPIVGDAWLGESALMRHLVSEDSSSTVAAPPLMSLAEPTLAEPGAPE
tara:strand:+ start:538 stop:843 length:306 start_codon:yes stop_codon:yes gene_type:complete